MPAELRQGRVFMGPAPYVGEGDSLCVALGKAPNRWVEVRLADFFAPELAEPGGSRARDVLIRITRGRRVECVAGSRSLDRVVAVCRIAGVSIGDMLRAAGVAEGGSRWTRPSGP